MRRISRDPQQFDLMRVIDAYARAKGVEIRDPASQEALLAELAGQIEKNRRNDILVHGLRVESMFAFVAAALGACRIIKQEDAGELYSADADIRAPDYRVVLLSGRQLLIEVKNCHTNDPDHEFRLTRAYLESLTRYASAHGLELFVAIYWSRLAQWTLVSPGDFESRNEEFGLSFPKAMERDGMSILGDTMIGTLPSLTVKFLSDPTKPRAIDAAGHANFTIGDVQIYCGDELIEDDREKQIAWFLINYGSWHCDELPAEIENGDLISFEIRAAPIERANPNERFEIVGRLSEMIARQYNGITAPEGHVRILTPEREPGTLGVIIPPEFKGKALPLWRFKIEYKPQL